MTGSLTSKTVNGLKWSYASTITNSVLQIGYTAVMARLLDPKSFGLIAMASVLLRFGSYFAQMGMGRAIIQKKEINSDDVSIAFTASVLISFIFLLFIFILAPFTIYIFPNPEIIPILQVLAVSLLLTGFSTTSLALLRRDLRFKSLAVIEIVSYLISYGGVGVTFAFLDFGVWSLVFASLSQGLFTVIISYFVTRHPLRFTFNFKLYKPLFSFGSKVSFISFLEFLGANLDTLIIGKIFGSQKLGFYNRAFMLVNLPMQQFTTSLSKVLFTSFSRIQTEKERLKKAYLSSITLSGYIIIAACIGIAVSAEQIVLVVLGDKWKESIIILQILALAAPFNLLSHFGGIVCEATARLKAKLIFQSFYIILLLLFFLLFYNEGIMGIAKSILLAEVIRHVFYIFTVRKIFTLNFSEILSSYYPGLLSGLITGIVIFLVTAFLKSLSFSNIYILALQILSGLVAIILSIFLNKSIKSEINDKLGKLINLSDYKNKTILRRIRILLAAI